MLLYVASGGYDYEGFEILGIFDTKEKAEDRIKRCKDGDRCHDSHDIEVLGINVDSGYSSK